MGGLVGYGAYIPYYRLERSRIAAVLGSGGGRGTRAVAAYDEDTTSMAVAAGRAALAGSAGRESVRQLFFATAVPAYADKTNATAVHAALRLPADALAVDMAGAVRSGVGALVAAAQSPVPAMVVLSDIRTGLPGSAEERDGGDGAAAFVFGGADSAPRGGVFQGVRGDGFPPGRKRGVPPGQHCRCWPRSSGRAARPPSSLTGGGRPAPPPRGCGRSGSASRCTGRWPRPRSPTR